MPNPFLERQQNRSKGQHGNNSEKRINKSLANAISIKGSGAIEGLKGDTRLPNFLVESKATINQSYSVKLDTLKKIGSEASAISLVPALTISFTDNEGKAVHHGDWVCIPLYAFKELTEL